MYYEMNQISLFCDLKIRIAIYSNIFCCKCATCFTQRELLGPQDVSTLCTCVYVPK